jgi:hypothetical protein
MNKKQNAKVMPGMALFGAVVLMGAYAMNSVAEEANAEEPAPEVVNCEGLGAASKIVKIKFEANGCPITAIPDKFEITGTEKFICWESVDSAGNRRNFHFELFFDPFNGAPHGSGGNGLVRAKINKDAPITESGVDYKYTVSGKDCPDKDAKFYDPRFTVRR